MTDENLPLVGRLLGHSPLSDYWPESDIDYEKSRWAVTVEDPKGQPVTVGHHSLWLGDRLLGDAHLQSKELHSQTSESVSDTQCGCGED